MCFLKKYLLIGFVFCLFVMLPIGCIQAQSKQSYYTSQNKFDIKTFDKKKKKKTSYTFNSLDVDGDSVRVTYLDDASFYIEYIEKLGTPFVIQKKYDKRTLNLIKKSQTFYKNNYGYSYNYDIFGNLTEKKNEDKEFAFSLEQLRNLMLEKYNLDIFVKNKDEDKNPIIQRAVNPSVYYIKLPINDFRNKAIIVDGIRKDLFEIDGDSGQILEAPNQPRVIKNNMIDILNEKKEN